MTIKQKKKLFVSIVMIVIASIWCFGIYTLSDMNTDKSNGHSKEIISIFIEDSIDVTNELGLTSLNPAASKIDKASKILNLPLRKVMHASVYFVLSLVIIIYVNYLFDVKKYILSGIIAIILCAAFASTDEYHQTYVAGRTGQVKDVLIDTAGAVAGVLVYGAFYGTYRLGYRRCTIDLLDERELDETKTKKSKKKK